jgi:hypothetical protein
MTRRREKGAINITKVFLYGAVVVTAGVPHRRQDNGGVAVREVESAPVGSCEGVFES